MTSAADSEASFVNQQQHRKENEIDDPDVCVVNVSPDLGRHDQYAAWPACWLAVLDLASYGLPPSAMLTSVMAFCARTLFPAKSTGGEKAAIPNLPGETAMM